MTLSLTSTEREYLERLLQEKREFYTKAAHMNYTAQLTILANIQSTWLSLESQVDWG